MTLYIDYTPQGKMVSRGLECDCLYMIKYWSRQRWQINYLLLHISMSRLFMLDLISSANERKVYLECALWMDATQQCLSSERLWDNSLVMMPLTHRWICVHTHDITSVCHLMTQETNSKASYSMSIVVLNTRKPS